MKLYELCPIVDNSIKKINFFIPENELWTYDTTVECSLNDKNKGLIRVTASSVYQDQAQWNPLYLFNGKNLNGWATKAIKPSFLIIAFEKPVAANILSITATTDHVGQPPKKFEVFGSNDSFHYKNLKTLNDITWEPTKTIRFLLNNNEKFHFYKIVFHESKSTIFAMSRLNLGQFEI